MIRYLYHKAETIPVIFLVRLLKLWALAVAFAYSAFFCFLIAPRLVSAILVVQDVNAILKHTYNTAVRAQLISQRRDGCMVHPPPSFPHSAPTHVNPRCDDVTNLTVGGVKRFTPAVRHIHVTSLHESCSRGRRIVVMKLIFSLGHCECDGHTVQNLSALCLTADLLAPRESDCSRMRNMVSSHWFPSYIEATRPVLEEFRIAAYFPDSPRNVLFPTAPQCSVFALLHVSAPACSHHQGATIL